MTTFKIYTLENAPEASNSALNGLHEAFGIVPNVAGAMAESPVLLGCLAALFKNVHGGSFSERQIQILTMPGRIVTVPPGFPAMTSSGIVRSVVGAAKAAVEGVWTAGSSDTGTSRDRSLPLALVAEMLYDRNSINRRMADFAVQSLKTGRSTAGLKAVVHLRLVGAYCWRIPGATIRIAD